MLGTYVQGRMEELGLSVEEVAEAVGVTEQAIYLIRSGKRSRLHPGTWLKLAEVLRCPVEQLMRLADSPQGSSGPRKIAAKNGGMPTSFTA